MPSRVSQAIGWCAWVLLSSGALGCGQVRVHKEVDPDRVRFQTTSSSVLFFKNVRQRYYDRQEVPGNGMYTYRISERRQTPEGPLLHLAIVHNWRYDEAYVLVEPNEVIGRPDVLEVEWEAADTAAVPTGRYRFAFGNKKDHFRFAGYLHRSIQAGHRLFWRQPDGTRTPLLQNRQDREAFRKTMVDYYRLVDLG